MTPQTSQFTRIRRWLPIFVATAAWLSIGCNPAMLTMFLLPFADNKKDPEHLLFAADKEITLVVLSKFSETQTRPEYAPADIEFGESVAGAFRKRCQENKHKLKLIPQPDVRSHYLTQLAQDGDTSPTAIGKKFKADYVLTLNIDSFSLYQKDALPRMYRGNARVNIDLYNVNAKGEDPLVYTKNYNVEFTGSRGVPIEVGNSNPADFRQLFVRRMARDVSRMFIAFPLDELKEWD